MTEPQTSPIEYTPTNLAAQVLARIAGTSSTIKRRAQDVARVRQHGYSITRPDAIRLAAQMVSYPDKNPDEEAAVRILMRRHNLSGAVIAAEWRRLSGVSRGDTPPMRYGR